MPLCLRAPILVRMYNHAEFLAHPGLAGPFGGLLDEYARAAEDFCKAVESVSVEAFLRQHDSPDPDCRSIQAVCLHVLNSARGYANYLRKARNLAVPEIARHSAPDLSIPLATRSMLAAALRYTEASVDGIQNATDAEILALSIRVSWGPTLDPELLLEHAIVHLLRHRRQIERWQKEKGAL